MRVAFVAEVTAQHEETGARRRLRRTAELLAARGHDVLVFCSKWWDGDHETFERANVTYRAVTTEPPGEVPSRRFALSLPGALRRAKPDVIHAAAVPKMTVNEAFARYDHQAVLEQYLDCYRDVQDSFGLF